MSRTEIIEDRESKIFANTDKLNNATRCKKTLNGFKDIFFEKTSHSYLLCDKIF